MTPSTSATRKKPHTASGGQMNFAQVFRVPPGRPPNSHCPKRFVFSVEANTLVHRAALYLLSQPTQILLWGWKPIPISHPLPPGTDTAKPTVLAGKALPAAQMSLPA